MSTIKADTLVASDGTSPVTLTKQEAVKFWTNYDASSQTTDGSLNQSSVTDESAGRFYSSFTSNFSSATDRCVLLSTWNTTNDATGAAAGNARGLTNIAQGSEGSGSIRTATTSEVQYCTVYGSNGSSNGDVVDLSASYVAQLGDLA